MQNFKINIIGAGVSGLCAAITLQKAGYSFQIYDAHPVTGGRVGTDYSNGHILDHGFQVLLDAYPAAREFLDLDALELKKFEPGSFLFKDGKKTTVGDPTRAIGFLIGTAFANVGTLKDKIKIFTLSRKLKNKSIADIFDSREMTTLQYLEEAGFSKKMISNFFKPFYAGIFLEEKLDTSSRMFEFVFKMFAQGNATIPANGIASIPAQLTDKLDAESFNLNKRINRVVGQTLSLEDGTTIKSDYTIIATQADRLVPNLPISNLKWHEVTVLYFKTTHKGFGKPVIGLLSAPRCFANNFHFLHDVFSNHDPVVSVTVVRDHQMSQQELIATVAGELQQHASIEVQELIKSRIVKKALPQLKNINNYLDPTETQLTDSVFLAGDHLSNGSLNAAMFNGKSAAMAVINQIENKVTVG